MRDTRSIHPTSRSGAETCAAYAGNPAENYERYFIPAIGGPLAEDLVELAEPSAGSRVLDVGCGTGIVARLAAERVGRKGRVDGLDGHPAMLAVARAAAPADPAMEWYEASADAMPLSDDAYDLVTCQMALQFFPDPVAALREMRRVLTPGGRIALGLPGPAPEPMARLAPLFARHLGPEPAGFVDVVFWLHDPDEVRRLLEEAGFHDVSVRTRRRDLTVPPAADFLWQYVHSTPLAPAVDGVPADRLDALQRDVVDAWSEFDREDGMAFVVPMTEAVAVA